MSYVLGIDLGTSSLKGVLVDKSGTVIQTISSPYPLIQLKSGYNEQEPYEWTKALEKVIVSFIEHVSDFQENLEGISFSGQMHSLVLTDEENKVLRPAILWNDVRNTDQCQQIMDEYGDELLNITHNIAIEGFTLPKILWVQQNEPLIWERVRNILLPKDYLRYWLTGTKNMDYSDAAGTLLLDMKSKEWSNDIIEKYDIPKYYLPELVNSTDHVGNVTSELSEKFGFINEVKVFAGGADNASSAVASGIVDDKVALASIGTSGVFLSAEKVLHNEYDGKLHFFNHAVTDAFYSMGVTLAAGYSLDWFKNTFAPELDFDVLLDTIKNIPIGSQGLMFSPYIVGERTPHFDSEIRGSFIGIDAKHSLAHFTKAVIEGITFSLRDSKELMESVSNKAFHTIVSVGGGAKNKDWQQIQADIFDTKVVTLAVEEGPGFGAAMIAAVGAGWFNTMADCSNAFIKYSDPVTPNKDNVAKYNDLYPIYHEIYKSTKSISHKLSAVRGE